MNQPKKNSHSLFDLVFDIGVIIKGIDGLAELVAGVALLISPGLVHTVLSIISGHAGHGQTHVHHLIAQYTVKLDNELAVSGLVFLIIFLISHGVIKLALVYCLLKKIVKAYPYALVILVLFLVYQIYVFVTEPNIGMALFCLLDVAIIGLVWREYRILSSEKMV